MSTTISFRKTVACLLIAAVAILVYWLLGLDGAHPLLQLLGFGFTLLVLSVSITTP